LSVISVQSRSRTARVLERLLLEIADLTVSAEGEQGALYHRSHDKGEKALFHGGLVE